MIKEWLNNTFGQYKAEYAILGNRALDNFTAFRMYNGVRVTVGVYSTLQQAKEAIDRCKKADPTLFDIIKY